MHVICIKCNKQGSLSLNHYKSHGHRYQYYGIQHYNRDTKKRHWCYLGKYESLPDQYKTMIHNKQLLSTTDPQTHMTGKTHVFSEKLGAGSGIRTPPPLATSPAYSPSFLGLKCDPQTQTSARAALLMRVARSNVRAARVESAIILLAVR